MTCPSRHAHDARPQPSPAPAAPDAGSGRHAPARALARRLGPAVLLALASGHAAATPIACPVAIVETPAVTSVWPGWAADVRAGRRLLAAAAVYVSRGSERGGVAPDASHARGRDTLSTWSLQPGEGDVYWVGCSYADTSATLFQRIPETARRCSAASEIDHSGKRLQGRTVDCE